MLHYNREEFLTVGKFKSYLADVSKATKFKAFITKIHKSYLNFKTCLETH
jgi:hypothetical protein